MATKSIGATGRDYATLALWGAYLDTLNTLSAPEVGECYNDAEFTAGHLFSGFVASSTNTVTLTTAAGQGFKDHANASTNPLTYDSSKGVGITASTDYSILIQPVSYMIFENLQIKNGGSSPNGLIGFGETNVTIKKCILEGKPRSSAYAVVSLGTTAILQNNLIDNRSTTGHGVKAHNAALSIDSCTIVRPSNITPSGTAITTAYAGTYTILNTAVFGHSTFKDANGTDSGSDKNGTDLSSGVGVTQSSLTFTSQFQDTNSTGGCDFRIVSGGSLDDNGGTGLTTDIIGTSRPQNSTDDIGCWEIASASVASQTFRDLMKNLYTLSCIFGPTTSTYSDHPRVFRRKIINLFRKFVGGFAYGY